MRAARNIARRLLAMLGAGLAVSAAPASAAPAVPQEWRIYADVAGDQLAARLGDPADAAAVRLHAWLSENFREHVQDHALEPGRRVPSFVVQVWVAPSGQVRRVEAATLGHVQADADLRAVLTARPLPAPPPHMRLPMVLELALRQPGTD